MAARAQLERSLISERKRLTGLMTEIAAASEAKKAGAERGDTAVTQMEEVTQHNAALVEESSAATRSIA
jgi:methyl-accepting chemotaxis protein